jgi:hypothetical protein
MTMAERDDEDLQRLADETIRQIEVDLASVPEHLRQRYFVRRAAERLLYAMDLDGLTDGQLSAFVRTMIKAGGRFLADLAKPPAP